MSRFAWSRCGATSTSDSEEELVPPVLSQLIEQLGRRSSPTLASLPRLSGNLLELGDYFKESVDTRRKSTQWWQVRLRVLERIGSCPTLTQIDLAGCGIAKELEVEQLCRGLQGSQVLEDLNLSLNRGFGTEHGCQELCTVLRSCPRLQLLYLGRVGMQASGLGHIMETLSSAELPLQRLYLWKNERLGDVGVKLVADFLSNRQVQAKTQLKVLDIGHARLSVRGAAILSEALQANCRLEVLLIGETKTRGSVGAVLRSLIRSPASFAISGIGIMVSKEEGLGALIAQMLACNKLLRALYLDRSEFSAREWRTIFTSLLSNASLQYLSLANCRGVEAFLGLEDVMCGRLAPLSIVLTGTALEKQGKHGLIEEALKREPKARRLFLLDSDYPLPSGCLHIQGSGATPSTVHVWQTEDTDIQPLPHQIQVLIEDLKAATPTLVNLPPLADVEEFGDYFVETSTNSSTRAKVRLQVFHLIGHCTSLTTVNLYSCGIELEVEVEALCSGLKMNPVLQGLYVDWNTGFGSEFGCQQIALLLEHSESINLLSLVGIGMGKRAFGRIVEALDMNGNIAIVQLNIAFNPNLGAEIIASFLLSHAGRELGQLRMQGIGMTVQGAKQLASAFLQSPWVYVLIVGDEPEWVEDGDGPFATLLRPLIHHQPSTTSLYLTLGLIGAQEKGLANVVCEVLLRYHVWELGLNRCQFSPEEWRNLFISLRTAEALAVLSLEGCRNLEDAFEDIMDVLEVNLALQQVILHGTALEQTGLDSKVRGALRANRSDVLLSGMAAEGMVDAPRTNSLVHRPDSSAYELIPADENLPLGLRSLIHDLAGVSGLSPPKLPALAKRYRSVSPLTANVKDFGNYFNPEQNVIKEEQRQDVRMLVFGLIADCRTVSEIDLRGCCISESEEVRVLCQGLSTSPCLEVLYLDGNVAFGSEFGCKQVSTIVNNSRTLRKLSLAYQRMVTKGLYHIIQGLLQNGSSALRTLSIRGNLELADTGVQLIADFLQSGSHRCSSLTEIAMSEVGMGCIGAESLAKSLMSNRFLETLHVGEQQKIRTTGVNLSSDSLKAVLDERSRAAEAVPAQGPISCFLNQYVVHYGLSREDTLTKASRNESLKCLHIRFTNEQGLGKYISEVLKHIPLKKLGIQETRLSTLEWQTVFEAVQSKLETLSLKNAEGLEFVLKDLLKLLETDVGIKKIKLSGTALERTGADALVSDALRRNSEREVYLSILRDHFKLVKPRAGRLFLCGPPFAGKTTLCSALNLFLKVLPPSQKFWRDIGGSSSKEVSSYVRNYVTALESVPQRTRGIEIHTMDFANDLQVSVWDLAGQAEFHALHQCLFPDTNHACVFLFVFSMVDSTTRILKDDMGRKLREDLCYWLRFIASNSNSVTILPRASVILTHFDELGGKLSREDITDLAKQAAVIPLRNQFKGVLDLAEEVHVVGLKGHLALEGIPSILHHIFSWFCELLSKLPEVSQVCGEVSKILRHQMSQKDAQPIMSIADFKALCWNGAFEDVTENVDEAIDAVISYLHSIGDIISFKSLGCVVVSPHWFAHTLLGQLMNPETYRQQLFPPYSEEGRVSRPILERFLLACLKHPNTGFSLPRHDITPGHLLIEIMLHLNLCYKVGSNTDNVELFFVPILLDDPDETAWKGQRQREWPAKDDAERTDTTCMFFGRRLQCKVPTITFLIPGFFPTFQVGFRKLPHEAKERPLFKCDRNLISWSPDSFEVLIECSGDTDTYIDILVRSFQKTHLQSIEFIEHVVKDIRDFCASGCPRVVLSEAILRPECVKQLTLFMHRKEQSVLVEDIKDLVVEKFRRVYLATDDESRAIESVIDHAHTWPVNVKEAGLGPYSESVVALLGARECFKLLEICVSISHRKQYPVDHQQHDLEAFTSVRLRDPQLNTGEGLKKSLLDCFVTKQGIPSGGRKLNILNKDTHASYPWTNVGRGKRRGLAVIISMEKDRPGGAVDRGRLETLARCTLFEHEVLVDCTASDLRSKLKILAENAVVKEDDCFLCCVNAHGGTDAVGGQYIVDPEGKKCFLVADILEPFKRSKQLAGKPKVFFVSACRGPLKHAKSGFAQEPPQTGPENEILFLKDLTDWLLVFSTTAHSLSWREETEGSTFVKALVEAVIRHRHDTDLLNIMTNVNYVVSSVENEVRNEAGRLQGRFAQSPVVQHTLRKRLYWREGGG